MIDFYKNQNIENQFCVRWKTTYDYLNCM